MSDQPIKKILAVGAHPDDIEFMTAGALIRLKRLGFEITLATLTPGDCGSATLPPDEIAAIRRKEAAKSASILSAEYHCLEERDLAIDYDATTRRKVTGLFRRVRPDLVLAHSRQDYMVDHEIASLLARDACFSASVPNYVTPGGDPPTDSVPYLYYWDPMEGTDYQGNRVIPEFAVDITEVMETKREMLACHASQREWLRKQHGIDQYLASMESWCDIRGSDFGYDYAEGFTQHRGHSYPQENVLLRLLASG